MKFPSMQTYFQCNREPCTTNLIVKANILCNNQCPRPFCMEGKHWIASHVRINCIVALISFLTFQLWSYVDIFLVLPCFYRNVHLHGEVSVHAKQFPVPPSPTWTLHETEQRHFNPARQFPVLSQQALPLLIEAECPIFRRVGIISTWWKMTLTIRLRRVSPKR
jgi:hypothetical protein